MKKRERPVVGQELWLVDRWGGQAMACTVSSVGRKYFKVSGWCGTDRTRFFNETWNRDTGRACDLYESEQEYLEEREARDLRAFVSDRCTGYGLRGLTLDQLRRIKAIVEE